MVLLSNAGSHWATPVLTCSALTGQGVSNIWDHISDHHTHAQETVLGVSEGHNSRFDGCGPWLKTS